LSASTIKALIGATGFVGGNLPAEFFSERYHSKNIQEIRGRRFDLVVCAGAPAAKWKANQDPDGDLANLRVLMDCLGAVECNRFVLISTVDVFGTPLGVDESSMVNPAEATAYGRHRYFLEEFVRERFRTSNCIRLPGLYGSGLKKNIIFDLLHRNTLHLTHADSEFQFYHLARLFRDMETALARDLPLVHLAVEAVKVRDMVRHCFGEEFDNVTPAGPVRYDLRTRFGELFGGTGAYIQSAADSLDEIRAYVQSEQAARL